MEISSSFRVKAIDCCCCCSFHFEFINSIQPILFDYELNKMPTEKKGMCKTNDRCKKKKRKWIEDKANDANKNKINYKNVNMKLILDYIWPFLLRSFPLLCAFFSFFLWRFNFLLCFPVHVAFITFIIFIWHWPIHTYWLPLPQNSEVTSQSSHLIYLPFPIRYNTIVIILKMLRKMP